MNMTAERIKEVLELHRLWLGSNGQQGERAKLFEANLSGADLSGANLSVSYLYVAALRVSDLRVAYLRGAYLFWANLSGAKLDYQIEDGLLQKIAKKVTEEPSCLHMSSWHCGTAHCIAGWACELAKGGKELEESHGPSVAGLLLLGSEAHSHFYDDDETALAWLQSKVEL